MNDNERGKQMITDNPIMQLEVNDSPSQPVDLLPIQIGQVREENCLTEIDIPVTLDEALILLRSAIRRKSQRF